MQWSRLVQCRESACIYIKLAMDKTRIFADHSNNVNEDDTRSVNIFILEWWKKIAYTQCGYCSRRLVPYTQGSGLTPYRLSGKTHKKPRTNIIPSYFSHVLFTDYTKLDEKISNYISPWKCVFISRASLCARTSNHENVFTLRVVYIMNIIFLLAWFVKTNTIQVLIYYFMKVPGILRTRLPTLIVFHISLSWKYISCIDVLQLVKELVFA